MDVSGKFVFSLRLISSWLISFLSIEQPIYFLFFYCLQARVFKRTQNLNPFSSTETMKHGQTAFHKNFCKMTMEMGKGMVMKMSNNVMERVLDRGKSMPYHLCQDPRESFSGVVREMVVNLMWIEAELLWLSAPPPISSHPILWVYGRT